MNEEIKAEKYCLKTIIETEMQMVRGNKWLSDYEKELKVHELQKLISK